METKNINSTSEINNYKNQHQNNISDVQDMELCMKSMINSCCAYGGFAKDSDNYQRYILPYTKEMSKKLFEEVYNEQAQYLSKRMVNHNVYTDSEGCTYNEIV